MSPSPKPPKKKAAAKNTAVTWGQRPSTRPQVSTAAIPADSFVSGAKAQTIRLNLNIPRVLHVRIKSQCALQGRNMTDVIMELLETHFPSDKGA